MPDAVRRLRDGTGKTAGRLARSKGSKQCETATPIARRGRVQSQPRCVVAAPPSAPASPPKQDAVSQPWGPHWTRRSLALPPEQASPRPMAARFLDAESRSSVWPVPPPPPPPPPPPDAALGSRQLKKPGDWPTRGGAVAPRRSRPASPAMCRARFLEWSARTRVDDQTNGRFCSCRSWGAPGQPRQTRLAEPAP